MILTSAGIALNSPAPRTLGRTPAPGVAVGAPARRCEHNARSLGFRSPRPAQPPEVLRIRPASRGEGGGFPRPPGHLSPARAFTLIELMVALAIFILVVATIYTTWLLIIRSTSVARKAAVQAQRERIAIRTVESALMCIRSFQASMQYYSFVVENGPEPVLSFTARLPDQFPRDGKFGDAHVRRVSFSLEPGADTDKNLVVRQAPILMDQSEDEKNFPLILARNVKEFVVECWDTNQMAWVNQWDETNSIPPVIRVSFKLGSRNENGEEGDTLSLTRIIALPCSTVPSVIQNGAGGGPPRGGLQPPPIAAPPPGARQIAQ